MLTLQEANELFIYSLKELLYDSGYFYKEGVFRKIRKDKLFIIEAALEITEDNRLSPIVNVAEVKVKFKKDGTYRTPSGLIDDEVTFESAKKEKQSFYKRLRHLKDLSLNEYEITESEVLKIVDSCLVAQNVCENKAIPKEYKELMKNDVPFEKAAVMALVPAFLLFIFLTVVFGLLAGLVVFVALGFTQFWGLFTVPEFYLITAAISTIYGIYTFSRIRMGRF